MSTPVNWGPWLAFWPKKYRWGFQPLFGQPLTYALWEGMRHGEEHAVREAMRHLWRVGCLLIRLDQILARGQIEMIQRREHYAFLVVATMNYPSLGWCVSMYVLSYEAMCRDVLYWDVKFSDAAQHDKLAHAPGMRNCCKSAKYCRALDHVTACHVISYHSTAQHSSAQHYHQHQHIIWHHGMPCHIHSINKVWCVYMCITSYTRRGMRNHTWCGTVRPPTCLPAETALNQGPRSQLRESPKGPAGEAWATGRLWGVRARMSPSFTRRDPCRCPWTLSEKLLRWSLLRKLEMPASEVLARHNTIGAHWNNLGPCNDRYHISAFGSTRVGHEFWHHVTPRLKSYYYYQYEYY